MSRVKMIHTAERLELCSSLLYLQQRVQELFATRSSGSGKACSSTDCRAQLSG